VALPVQQASRVRRARDWDAIEEWTDEVATRIVLVPV
jgi:hypothetical protein